MRRVLIVILVLSATTLGLPTAAHAQEAADPGRSEAHTYGPVGTYRTYTPASYGTGSAAVPLVVVVHGCTTTAASQEAANRQNRIAERERFVILYPDMGQLGPSQCWDWYTAKRDVGDAALVVGMVREVLTTHNIDPQRVYVIGMSSGGMLTSVLMAEYPDLFAAGGLMAGIAYKDVACPFTGVTIDPNTLADLALDAMGPRARVVPMIILRGTEDGPISKPCGDTAAAQWAKTNSLILGADLVEETARVSTPGRYDSDVTRYNDPAGCLVIERWEIQGMGHFWSGGSAEPGVAAYTDPKGPDAGVLSWRFFSRYRLADTAPPCAEATAGSDAAPSTQLPPPAGGGVSAAPAGRRTSPAEQPAIARVLPVTGGGVPILGMMLLAAAASLHRRVRTAQKGWA